MHVCFKYGGEIQYNCHLCSDHAELENNLGVTWQKESFFSSEVKGFLASAPPASCGAQVPSDMAPPTYDEAIKLPDLNFSTWKDDLKGKPQQLLRQYSSGRTNTRHPAEEV